MMSIGGGRTFGVFDTRQGMIQRFDPWDGALAVDWDSKSKSKKRDIMLKLIREVEEELRLVRIE